MTKHEHLLAALIEERWPRRRVEEDAIAVVDPDAIRVARVFRRAQAIRGRIERMDPEPAEVKLRRQAHLVAEADVRLRPPPPERRFQPTRPERTAS